MKYILQPVILIPLRTSLTNLIRESFSFICFTCSLQACVASTPTITTMTANPTKMEGPITKIEEDEREDNLQWCRPCHVMLMNTIVPINHWASTDIELTTSLTVLVWRALLLKWSLQQINRLHPVSYTLEF